MKNKITLKFNNTLSKLSGNSFGHSIYEEQVAPYFKEEGCNVIVFPNNITGVAISFAQGFVRDIVDKFGKINLDKYISIESSSEELSGLILDKMKS